MTTTAAPRTVLETILDWSVDRPMWQRDALRRIIAVGTPNDAAIAELLALCKKEHGATGCDLEPVALEVAHLPANPANGASVTISSLSDIVGVNQLAPGQTLPFETAGLTIVYGPNGAGKSGYGRVLKRACRARKAGEIMPDAYQPAPTGKATASFSILKDGIAADPVAWSDTAGPHNVLSAISVFDRDCGSVHVQEKNEVAFRPFGLDISDDLAGVCQKLKQLLVAEEAQLSAARHPVFATPTWNLTTDVGKILSALAYNTDLATLETLGEMTAEERLRLARLREDLQKNPVEAAAAQRLVADDVRRLILALDGYAVAYSDEALQKLKSLADIARETRAAATAAADKAFGGLSVAGVGGTTWRALWEAARRYSEHAAYPGKAFPHSEHEICVLCHQPLTAEAKARLQDFESFIKADAEAQANASETAFNSALASFKKSKLDIRVIGSMRRRLAVQTPGVARAVLRFIASADLRRRQCLGSLSTEMQLTLTSFASSPKEQLQAIETAAQDYASQLDDAAQEVGRAKLIKERDGLADRDAVSALMDNVRMEVARLGTLRIVRRCTDDMATNAITKLGNDIADNVITPKMRDQFQSEIVSLAAEKVRVEIVRSGGQYGSPNYQVRLFANPKAKVHSVLSEGEQTCVALAAFLAELATASHKSALVFDDPVTSLDHRWRDKVAERLVKECKQRQIIVFTHDMVFVNDLHDKAARHGARAKLVSLSRGPSGTGIVTDGLPWQHASLKDRIDKLEKDGRAARALYDANDEEQYRDAAIGIYNRLRASWERGLEDVLFAGVILRHRDYIDAKNLRRVTAVEAADVDVYRNNFKKCSDLVEAHDPSRGRDASVPPPDEIMADIKTLADWAAAMRTKQNAIA
ncbi:AAA family ATPase [Bradyrhizobium valentinum]|uniref:AAA family ATPase n=1 Tax=Bradyrhizobium valentinum TaxID=1518501 RepID=UPI000709E911|nr:AAA family ATPase [Bradyrhizobium valentinum]KRR09831.1 DNA repair protein [Bradyrhizobium valentinum]